MKNLILGWWQNKHTSGAAIGVAILTVAAIWLPQYKDKLDETARALVVYGLLAAGDASQSLRVSKEQPTGEKA